MNKFKAATILKNTLDKHSDSFTEEGKEAIEEAILTLYKAHIDLTGSRCVALRCRKCNNIICLDTYNVKYDEEYKYSTFTANCPYCGKQYEWNDCYWR